MFATAFTSILAQTQWICH